MLDTRYLTNKNMKDLRTLIVEYLSSAKLMQVATSREGQPWICTVFFAFDNNLNLYWISKPDSRHSEEIRQNEKVSGTIVLPHKIGEKVRGIQLQGVAKKLSDKTEAADAMDYYAERFSTPKERVKAILDNTGGYVVYKITPQTFVLFDQVNFPDNPRQEYNL